MNEPGRIRLCFDCQRAVQICAMEDVVAALAAAKERLDYDIANHYENQYLLVPALEMGTVWDALAKYKAVQ